MSDEPITFRVNLGPGATIRAVQAAVDDLGTVLEFASELQRRSARSARDFARAIAFGGPSFGRFGIRIEQPFPYELNREDYELAATMTHQEIEANARVTVQSLRYENPLELVILASGVVVLQVARFLRDWPARRRLNGQVVAEYTNGVVFREEVRDRILAAIDNGSLPLTPELVESLLTDRVADAIGALGDADLKVSGLPQPPSADT